MRYPVFLSCPQPYLQSQQQFLERFREELRKKGLEPRTIGETDYTMDAPLEGIRSLLFETDGLIAVALKRHHVIEGKSKDGGDLGDEAFSLNDQYFTSPFCQIEPAMAYQLGLPTLVFREEKVVAEGMLEPRATGMYTLEFSVDDDNLDAFFNSKQFDGILAEFTHRVISVHKGRGSAKLWKDW